MEHRENKGIAFAAASYIFWGVLPIYWRHLKGIPAFEILNYRIISTFVSLGIYLVFSGKFKEYTEALTDWKIMKKIILSAGAIFINWGTFTYTMISDKIVEASLAYYICPLFMALTGVMFFKESIGRMQKYGITLAGIGVAVLSFGSGVIPVWGIVIAIFFAIYGAIKKTINLNPFISLTLEMTVALPFAFIFLFTGKEPSPIGEGQLIYLILLGAVTAIPLLLFVKGAQMAKFSQVALLQYIYPTMALTIGVLLYGEAFTKIHFVSFAIIWLAVIMFIIPFFKTKRKSINFKVNKR